METRPRVNITALGGVAPARTGSTRLMVPHKSHNNINLSKTGGLLEVCWRSVANLMYMGFQRVIIFLYGEASYKTD